MTSISEELFVVPRIL